MRFSERATVPLTTYGLLFIAIVITLAPIGLLFVNALKPSVAVVTNPLSLPNEIAWENFTRAWTDARFGRTMTNSTLLTVLTICFVCSSASLAGYVLARRHTKYWQALTFYTMAGTTVPIHLFLFPLYVGMSKLGFLNNILATSIIYTAIYTPFATMLMRTYFLYVPEELEEAARVDGAGYWKIFWSIVLPIVSPGILTVALIVGMDTWNEFLISLTFLQLSEKQTAIVAFYLLSGEFTSDWGEIMAAALIITAPVLLFFVLLQRRFIEGVAGGAVKG